MNSPAHTEHMRAETMGELCPTCRVSLQACRAFWVRGKLGHLLKCTRCSLLDVDLFKRSASVSLVVGTILVALNHGDTLSSGAFSWATNWHKIPLSYLVPFCVATYGALSNSPRS